MSWRSNRIGCALLASGVGAVLTAHVGCGRPAGPLFPPMDPPVVWPASPERPRIRLVGAIAGSHDLHAALSGMEVFKAAVRGPRPPIKLSGPHSVAVGPGHLLAVADAAAGAVHLLNLRDREYVSVTGWNEERFAVPIGIAWVGRRLFVTDAERHEVIELDVKGRFVRRFGGDALIRPVGVAYAETRGQLYVVDGGGHKIVVFALDGRDVRSIGERGADPGGLNFPTHICCRGEHLLVADSGNSRVQVMDLDGACLRVIGRRGDGAGDLSLPKGVAYDSKGHIYVVDSHFENVQIFDAAGRLLLAFGREGDGAGEFALPAGLAIDGRDRIWVADAANRRLQVFDYLRTEP